MSYKNPTVNQIKERVQDLYNMKKLKAALNYWKKKYERDCTDSTK